MIVEMFVVITAQQQIEMLPSDWKALAACESSLNPEALNPSGKYKGLFQFDDRSWNYVGGRGDPTRAPVREQYKRAKMLQYKQGWSAWPQCSKRLGLQ